MSIRTLFVTLSLTILYQFTTAQLTITGNITTVSRQILPYVVVGIRQGNALISTTISDSTGHYRIPNIKKGDYHLLISHRSYRDSIIPVHLFTDTTINLQLIFEKMLQQVEVTGKKPLIQMEIDRLRFNVKGAELVVGNNIWDVIEKTPLVTTSSDGSIQISGTSGVAVYLNNKKKVLTGAALKSYLSSMPADNLEAIEVITTPSSKYDAEGGGGILNIITKKKKEEGFEGNTTFTDRQTATNSQSVSAFLNNRTGNWDIYSNCYLVNRRRKPTADHTISFLQPRYDIPLSRKISSSSLNSSMSAGANLGIDYQFNKDHIFGLILDYSGNHDRKNRDAGSQDHFAGTDSISYSENRDKLNAYTYSLNLNYEGLLDAKGKKLDIDLDVLDYTSENTSTSKTTALDAATYDPLYISDHFRSSAPQQVKNQSFKADLHWPLSSNSYLDFGLRSSFSQIDNDLLFENQMGNSWTKDISRSNLFAYNENIHAAYIQLNQKINTTWSFQLGTRLENTIAKGYLEGERVVNRNYLNLFPTGYLKYSTSGKKTYTLAVSSRITRPGYWDVNPFRTYTTNKAYFEGNPFLLPSTYYREELSHSTNAGKGNIIFQLAASQTINEIYPLPFEDSTGVVVNKKTNYGNKYSYSAAAIYYNQLKKWWQLSATMLTGYVESKGEYGNNIAIDNQSLYVSLSTNQTFTLSKKQRLSCNLIANNSFPATIVNTRVGNRLDTELRLKKSAGAFSFTLSATDLLKTNKDNYRVETGELLLKQHYYNDTRSVAFILNYNFGKSTVKEKRDRDPEFENIKNRII
ncbi:MULTISPECIES: outer membrane beta-barrel family protein [Niastella]|uniref:Outer membrane beta-barrel protein n=1 Tax=Niastella soli TaxID=2821487 RepID=A0ABS3Z5R0_9BACT|nr:outer membrane beta-barrel family protein [Niastella soli]MBO9205484.1 outer membrane beta-barrel protein [Niastella soli]